MVGLMWKRIAQRWRIYDSGGVQHGAAELIGCADVLPQLFSKVFVPAKVVEKLSHLKTPEIVRR